MTRMTDKQVEIQKYLEELETILPKSYEDYKHSYEKRAACERYFEKIVESLIDMAFLVIKKERLEIPEDNKVFDTLFENKIISKTHLEKLQNAKGMRNIITHQYGDINNKTVYESVTEEIIQDSEEFLEQIEKYFSKK